MAFLISQYFGFCGELFVLNDIISNRRIFLHRHDHFGVADGLLEIVSCIIENFLELLYSVEEEYGEGDGVFLVEIIISLQVLLFLISVNVKPKLENIACMKLYHTMIY